MLLSSNTIPHRDRYIILVSIGRTAIFHFLSLIMKPVPIMVLKQQKYRPFFLKISLLADPALFHLKNDGGLTNPARSINRLSENKNCL